ncbi:MAG: ammonium transporter [Thermoguttaceae bacterium]
MTSGRRVLLVAGLLAAVSFAFWASPAATARAEEPPAAGAAGASKLDSGDNAWVLTSSALVLMMTGPALALFYCGLVRKKNVLSVMMQCAFLMCLLTVIWGLYGYTMAFGGCNTKDVKALLGDSRYLFMKGAEAQWVPATAEKPAHSEIPNFPEMTIPVMTHMLFQGMFFIITPALICGAFAERMKFSTMVVFMILWGTLIYCPLCHWVWGGGILSYGSDHAKISAGGALDFAGGTVVHISSGVSALVCALLLGKRVNYGKAPMPPHNMTYTVVGATMLWVGWFGFNAGSALQSNGLAASAFTATHFAAAAGGLTWACLEWIIRGKPSVLGCCSGIVAGLVCITPASGFVTPMYAFVMGVAVGFVCYFFCTVVKGRFGYDDSLDAFGVHGVGGTLGAILTGIFATRATGAFASDPKLCDKPMGLLEGGPVLTSQIIAVLVTWALALAGTFIILKVLDAVMGLRVSREAEIEGLDLSQHGEEGYIFI